MRILFLTHAFNSLAQRLFLELTRRQHEVSIEFDINDAVTIKAVALHCPDLVIAPFLKRAIPEAVWRRLPCLVVHPGVKGDRGPCALDWAIMNGEPEWGVTVLQANAEMDAGDVWATASFPMRGASKSSLYRREVTEAAVQAVLQAVARVQAGSFSPEPLDYGRADVIGGPHPRMGQDMRAIDWNADDTGTVMRKIRAADGSPGVLDTLFGEPYHLYDVHEEDTLRGAPGTVIAHRDGAICRATRTGAVWITHLRRPGSGDGTFKLPAARLLGAHMDDVAECAAPLTVEPGRQTYAEIRYEEKGPVGYLHFDFYNGAMGCEQCARLREAYRHARAQDTRVIVLMGGAEFWSNGIDLNAIEAAESPADESWRNINAMNDLVSAVITTDSHLVISALQGNAGAGGAFLALAADRIYVRSGVVLNPHYKGMGNLYGSEYWTYLLPRRVSADSAAVLVESRLPIGSERARELGFIDDHFGEDLSSFRWRLDELAHELAGNPDYGRLVDQKRRRREQDERQKPLERYRAEELEQMRLNFYGFDPSFHVARYNFVHKVPHSWTPLHLAIHRQQPGLNVTHS